MRTVIPVVGEPSQPWGTRNTSLAYSPAAADFGSTVTWACALGVPEAISAAIVKNKEGCIRGFFIGGDPSVSSAGFPFLPTLRNLADGFPPCTCRKLSPGGQTRGGTPEERSQAGRRK